jgi:hypothetical protein
MTGVNKVILVDHIGGNPEIRRTLKLAALQGCVDADEQFELDGLSDNTSRECIGNSVPLFVIGTRKPFQDVVPRPRHSWRRVRAHEGCGIFKGLDDDVTPEGQRGIEPEFRHDGETVRFGQGSEAH